MWNLCDFRHEIKYLMVVVKKLLLLYVYGADELRK